LRGCQGRRRRVAFILPLDSPASHFTIELGTKRNAVQLSFVPSWSGFRSFSFSDLQRQFPVYERSSPTGARQGNAMKGTVIFIWPSHFPKSQSANWVANASPKNCDPPGNSGFTAESLKFTSDIAYMLGDKPAGFRCNLRGSIRRCRSGRNRRISLLQRRWDIAGLQASILVVPKERRAR
jgi:hypothetical protein